jgi:capsular polysaccharide biosynthesis protein
MFGLNQALKVVILVAIILRIMSSTLIFLIVTMPYLAVDEINLSAIKYSGETDKLMQIIYWKTQENLSIYNYNYQVVVKNVFNKVIKRLTLIYSIDTSQLKMEGIDKRNKRSLRSYFSLLNE